MSIDRAPFSQNEYDRRLRKTRQAMEADGLDAVIVTDPSNMAWLSGYDGWSFYVHQAVIVTHDTAPYWWGRRMDGNGALRTVWMPDDHIHSYSDDYVMSPSLHAMDTLADLMKSLGHGGARIGVEMENYYYSARAHQVLTAALDQAVICDATGLVNWQRGIKSDEEIGFMKNAARIAENMVSVALERAEPGLPKNELVSDIYKTMISGVDDIWGDYPAMVPMLPSGKDASAAHLTWNGDPMKSGEVTFFELAGCYRRYNVPLCRTIHLGPAPQAIIDASKALTEGLEKGLEQEVAGNRACDIANALTETLAKAGIDRHGRCGYPIGISYPPDWGERTISLRSNDDSILEPGMTFHFMPGLWMDDWGIETTETILITDTGAPYMFTNLPRELTIKP
ncbi:MAG: ectoine hydrolase DoeA [Candidatus Puniceispirillum sp. TMED52]|nr:ectoine hydrolase DoeA [SAR116 cluster bacterium]OUU46264.1 MAG: ectoine hydrolase DoeA [Candidatus Puniceispirillum sp. TMED52]